MRSISCWKRFRSRAAFSLASFRADSRALTRSAVPSRRFSILGISERRFALSRSSCRTDNKRRKRSEKTYRAGRFQKHKLVKLTVRIRLGRRWRSWWLHVCLPACELWLASQGCSPGSRSSVSGQCWFLCHLSPSENSVQARNTHWSVCWYQHIFNLCVIHSVSWVVSLHVLSIYINGGV